MTPEYFTSVLSLLADRPIPVDAVETILGGYGSPRVSRLRLDKPFQDRSTLIAKLVPEGAGGEISAYRYLLAPFDGERADPVATVFAEEGGWWLFLTDWGDEPLGADSDGQSWREAGRWLARFQMAVLPDPPARLQPRERLQRWDRRGLRKKLRESTDRLLRYLKERRPPGGGELIDRYNSSMALAAERLGRSPDRFETRLHGDFKDKNLMVVRAGAGVRIRPVDWANAGFGSPFQDLSTLLRDRDGEAAGTIREAYFAERLSLGAEDLSTAERERGIQLHTLINCLLSVGILSHYLVSGLDVERSRGALERRRAQMEEAARALREWER